VRVDPGTQPAERGVGVDGYHRVIVADLREARPCAGTTVVLPIRVGRVVVMDHNPVRR
jgi:hypothetical protein